MNYNLYREVVEQIRSDMSDRTNQAMEWDMWQALLKLEHAYPELSSRYFSELGVDV